jgi:uncharacterized phage protein (TIGR01671 family)
MRQIRFRGKDKFTGKWVYGDLVHNKRVTTTGLEPRVMVGGYEVDEKTIGEYTGVIDGEGFLIYEGSIVQHYDCDLEMTILSEVIFDEENACFCFAYSNDPFACQFRDEYSVKGNVYDNPELLKGE